MAREITNLARIKYNYNVSEEDVAVSNITRTNLLDDYSLTAIKTSLNTNWRPSENITYMISITNNGTEPVYAISIQDDLGGTIRQLNYVNGSLRTIKDEIVSEIIPTSVAPLTAVLSNPLGAGETIIISYIAKVVSDIDSTVDEITNTVTVAGHELSDSGPVITVDPSPSLTLPRADYALVTMQKTVDKATVASGDTLTYTFKLENAGSVDATGVVITDVLPIGFTINSVQSVTNGFITVFGPEDYNIGESNTLTLPTSTSKTINVPAMTSSGVGITVVTIVGTIMS